MDDSTYVTDAAQTNPPDDGSRGGAARPGARAAILAGLTVDAAVLDADGAPTISVISISLA